MSQSSPYLNQSLSQTKQKYYQLAREIRGIQSRVFHLENADRQNRKRLEVIQQKNDSLQKIRRQKGQSNAMLQQINQSNEASLVEQMNRNQAKRRNQAKLIDSIWTAIEEEKRMTCSQMKIARANNQKRIEKIKLKALLQKRKAHDRVIELQRQAQAKIKDFHLQKSEYFRQEQNKQNKRLTKSIVGMETKAKFLQEQQTQLIESLRTTSMANLEATQKYKSLTKGSENNSESGVKSVPPLLLQEE